MGFTRCCYGVEGRRTIEIEDGFSLCPRKCRRFVRRLPGIGAAGDSPATFQVEVCYPGPARETKRLREVTTEVVL